MILLERFIEEIESDINGLREWNDDKYAEWSDEMEAYAEDIIFDSISLLKAIHQLKCYTSLEWIEPEEIEGENIQA